MTTPSINQEKYAENEIKTIWKWISGFYTNGFIKITWCLTLVIVISDDDPAHQITLNSNEIASSDK